MKALANPPGPIYEWQVVGVIQKTGTYEGCEKIARQLRDFERLILAYEKMEHSAAIAKNIITESRANPGGEVAFLEARIEAVESLYDKGKVEFKPEKEDGALTIERIDRMRKMASVMKRVNPVFLELLDLARRTLDAEKRVGKLEAENEALRKDYQKEFRRAIRAELQRDGHQFVDEEIDKALLGEEVLDKPVQPD